jgi:hypothetical protein
MLWIRRPSCLSGPVRPASRLSTSSTTRARVRPEDARAEIGQIVDQVAPRGDEMVIVKQFPNAFAQTDLDDRLKAASARNLVLAGPLSCRVYAGEPRARRQALSDRHLGFESALLANATQQAVTVGS